MNKNLPWSEALKQWLTPQVLVMLLLGFSAGIPILLIFSTLSVWLREAGVSRSAVTFFSWAALGYSFKFIWAPLVDLLPLPFLSKKLGKRRSWLLLSQCSIIAAIIWMSSLDPVLGGTNLVLMALAAVFLGFSSATQDIVIDAYRIELAGEEKQALLASVYIAGYRVGMLVAGAGSLFIASYFGTDAGAYHYSAWRFTYLIMAVIMLVGVVTTLCTSEPTRAAHPRHQYSPLAYCRFLFLFALMALSFALSFFYGAHLFSGLSCLFLPILGEQGASFFVEAIHLFSALLVALAVGKMVAKTGLVPTGMLEASYVRPVREFFDRFGMRTALLLLALVGCYRISDIVLGVISNVFYLDMGFSKNAIAGITKTFGLSMTLVGGFLGGVLTLRFGMYRVLMLGAVLASITNIFFALLVGAGENLGLLALVIGADNLCAGIASTAFVAFLSSLTNISFTAVQYAIFSSIMTLLPKFIGGYSGSIVGSIGYEQFFILTALMGVPVIILVFFAGKMIKTDPVL
ncbi:AmpG family muropeptide MFS transporter [Desulfotalea psychrophila]|nr:MFS transporter [Desulfotalea psychrophila]